MWEMSRNQEREFRGKKPSRNSGFRNCDITGTGYGEKYRMRQRQEIMNWRPEKCLLVDGVRSTGNEETKTMLHENRTTRPFFGSLGASTVEVVASVRTGVVGAANGQAGGIAALSVAASRVESRPSAFG